ncbi:MAG: hypothetical protein A3J51_02535 [Omnitrophica WOR_2 bacterium RIFCSPHIGHO2_02_FULL_45_21]|nr:MAG: hypothetical protein A3J51_02535 [Omnitrophica WOR_2 bacterium RIFCSPHIGHO2_02_FULL_45_21]
MTKTNKIDFKDLLKDEIEKKLKGNQRYFSRKDLRNLVAGVRLGTLNRYLVDFGKEGILYGAGRGWYSFVKQSFELDQRPVKKVIAAMEKKYPLLPFSVWSTEQLKSFAHHMLTRFVTFVYVDRGTMSGVYDFLKDFGYDVWLNPRGNDARKFSIGEKTVVIRPAVTRERSSGHLADIEKILVDLLVEASALNLMDEDEHCRVLGNILAAGRVDVGALLNYAKRRKLKTEGIIERIKSI